MKTEASPNALYTVTLPWHGMACPQCLSSDHLQVSFHGKASLTANGSVDSGDHEWSDYSRCTCTQCGFNAMALAFRMGDEDDEVPVPVHDTQDGQRPIAEAELYELKTSVSFALDRKTEDDKTQVILTRTIGDWELILFDKTLPAGSHEALMAYSMLQIGIHDHL